MTQRPVERVLEATLKDLHSATSDVGHPLHSEASTRAGNPEASDSQPMRSGRRATVRVRRHFGSDMQDLVAASIGWLIRIESPDCTSQFRMDLEQWLDEDVTHRVAVTIATRTRDRVNRLRNLRPVDGKVDPDLLLLPEYTPRLIERALAVVPLAKQDARRPRRVSSFRPLAAGVVGLCLLCVATARYNQLSTGDRPHIGDKQTVLLSDGESHAEKLLTVQQPRLCGDANGLLGWCNDDG
jgi:hypothetical protein